MLQYSNKNAAQDSFAACELNVRFSKMIIKEIIAVLIIFGAIFFFSSLESNTKTYKNLQEAKNDSLFKRGWLPDILPPSAYNINISTNLDTNESKGCFFIKENEFDLFLSKLKLIYDNNYKFNSFTFIINKSTGEVKYTNQSI